MLPNVSTNIRNVVPLRITETVVMTLLNVMIAAADGAALADLASATSLTSLTLQYVTGDPDALDPLSTLTAVSYFQLYNSDIVDLGALSSWPSLAQVNVGTSAVTDLTPLVDNPGIAGGDYLYFAADPIDCTAQAANIAALKSRVGSLYISNCP